MCVIVLVILRYLGLRKANVRSSFVRSPVMRDYVPFLRFFTYHGIVTCVVPVYHGTYTFFLFKIKIDVLAATLGIWFNNVS